MDPSTRWSRRRMLVASAATAGAALAVGPLGSAAAAAPRRAGAIRVATGLRRDHWTPLVGKKVTVAAPTGRVRATVVAIEDLRGAPVGAAHAFSVELRAERGPALAGVLPVTIPGRGVATLLLAAVDRGVRHCSSQIIVNSPTR